MYSRCKILSNFRFLGSKVSQCKNSSDVNTNKIYGKNFFKENVQNILQSITVINPDIIFKTRFKNEPLKTPGIEFMTEEQLKKEEMFVKKKISKLLQMPPVIDPVEDKLEILDSNESLDGHDLEHSKFLFTDLSDGYFNENRIIVVREPNGVLRKAFRNERHRMNEIYFPSEGRKYIMPKMFEKEHLQNLIKKKEYIFILDHACVQFDPDDPQYHQTINLTYNAINEASEFSYLESTRHFGSLAFYLVVHKKIDNLLIYMITQERLKDGMLLVQLYFIIHPECESAKRIVGSDENFLEIFIQHDALKKEDIHNTLENYFKKLENKKDNQEEKEAQQV